MKKSIIFFLLSVVAATAQTIPLYNEVGTVLDYGKVAGAYYKDINNELNPFTGTWEFINETSSFRIVLVKKINFYNSRNDLYEDVLIGEYRYVESGIEKVNTLELLNVPHEDLYSHSINGYLILGKQHRPVCSDCTVNERRILMFFNDPHRDFRTNLSGELILRRMDEGAIQKISVKLFPTGNVISIEGQPAPPNSFNVPWGTYILTKIN